MENFKKVRKALVIRNNNGLHTRPAAELARCAQNFSSQIDLIYRENRVSAKSLVGILMLAATRGAKVEVEAHGADAENAVEALGSLARNRFNVIY